MSNKIKKALNADQQQSADKSEDDFDEEMDFSEDEEGGTRVGGIFIPAQVKPYCSAESKGPRLIIRFIENTNFKSYANTVRVGPFHHRFSAVIGPNGSGKSNVIDSMLFVFGYRAQQIRSKKLSVLIHNSSKHPDVNSCKVSVHFQQILDKEDGSYELIPNTEIIISRTAFKNGSSFYSLNGQEKKFNEVANLLSEHNIDLKHNRFLILQGEVESIAMMKPKVVMPGDRGLLEYLEDIIGTQRYKRPLFLINERLEKLNDERMEKHNRCRLAEREMKDLELPMTQAVDYLKLENKLFQAQNVHYQLYIFLKKQDVVKIHADKEVATQALKKHDDQHEESKKLRKEKEKVIQAEIKKNDELIAKLEECKALEGKARGSYQRVDAKMKATNNNRKELKKKIEADQKKLEELNSLPERNNKEIDESKKLIERHTTEKNELDAKLATNLATLVNDTKPLQDEKEPLERELGTLKSSLDKLKADYSEAEKALEIMQQDETTESRKYESLRYSLEENKKQLEEKKSLLAESQTNIPKMKDDLLKKKHDLKALQDQEIEVSDNLRKVRAKLEENRSNAQAAKSNNRVLNALMNEKRDGRLLGVLGRLGDLGGIDQKYDVAISTCCGRLDNIVVEDVATAQNCIQFLKDNNIGRGSFIALEKITHLISKIERKQQYPQNVPRLFDLIRVEDQRILPAFYFALYETLVSDNMEQARAIAYGKQRYRVVTLNGDLIEISGTMSGGGKFQMRGKMGQKVQTKTTSSRNSMSEKDIDALSTVAQNLQARINDYQQQQGILEDEIKQLSVAIGKKEQELSRFQVQVKSFAEQIPRLVDQLERQKCRADSTKADPAQTAALEEKVKECKIDFETKETEVEQIQTKVSGLNKQIKEISDKKVKDLKVKIDKLVKQIDKLKSNVNKLTVEINTTDRNIHKVQDSIENFSTGITEAENSMRKMAEEREDFMKDIEALEKRIEEVKNEIEAGKTDSSSIKKEIDKLQKEEAEGKLKRLELDDAVKALEKCLKEQTAKIPAWEKAISALKLHEIPNDTMPNPPFKTYTDEELAIKRSEDTQYDVTSIEELLSADKPNLGAIDEYNIKRCIYMERIKVLEDVTVKRNEMREAFDSVKKKRFAEFTEGFQIISRKLKEMYQMITLGGDAELELVDSMDPFTEGIVFSVRPPKKSWKVITNLSGGEKTLSSLALVFALHYYKPSPLYFMDEIDAALDFKNVSIVANYINERTKNAQFIIISLRSNMFELADYLVGIYKVEDCTHSLTIENFDKNRVLGIGEKENYSGNAALSAESPKESQVNISQEPERLQTPEIPASTLTHLASQAS